MEPWQAPADLGLSLIFGLGHRPGPADIARLAQSSGTSPDRSSDCGYAGGFAISHQPEPSAGSLELFAEGIVFDVSGLAPAIATPIPAMAYWYGFEQMPGFDRTEAITLTPGKNLQGAANALPVIRAMVGIAAQLVELAHVRAVVWHPARSVMAPAAFITAIEGWLRGGAFPALGLTALFRDSDGAIRSEGLAFFTGQELRIEPSPGTTTAFDAKIAARLINQLVGNYPIHQRFDFIGPNGEQFSVEPSGNERFLRVWRRSL